MEYAAKRRQGAIKGQTNDVILLLLVLMELRLQEVVD